MFHGRAFVYWGFHIGEYRKKNCQFSLHCSISVFRYRSIKSQIFKGLAALEPPKGVQKGSKFGFFRCLFRCFVNILLHHLGFRGTVHSWLKSFLTNRYQYVSCGGASSQRVLVVRGVPQGSTLGPLLFLLYINDMHRCYDKYKDILFADDITVTCNGSNFNEVKNTADQGLVRIKDWLICNRLSLNVNKSSFIWFSQISLFHTISLCISQMM